MHSRFEIASAEVKDGRVKMSLWARALAEAADNEEEGRARYVKLRVRELRSEEKDRIASVRTEKAKRAHEADERMRAEIAAQDPSFLRVLTILAVIMVVIAVTTAAVSFALR